VSDAARDNVVAKAQAWADAERQYLSGGMYIDVASSRLSRAEVALRAAVDALNGEAE
jgi:hypothetical protein